MSAALCLLHGVGAVGDYRDVMLETREPMLETRVAMLETIVAMFETRVTILAETRETSIQYMYHF